LSRHAISELSSWCQAEPRLADASEDPARFSIPLPNGERAVVDVLSEPPLVTLACRVPFAREVTEHLSDADARAAVLQYIEALPLARSSLADVALAEETDGVNLRVRLHEEGLNGHTFLVAAHELIKLAELAEAGVGATARATIELREASRAFDEATRGAEEEAERVAREAHDRWGALEASTEAAVQGLAAATAPAAVACANCGAALAPDARFCVSCGTPVGNGAAVMPVQPAAPSACANCGAALAPGARFCVSCGTPVG
jgi:ribosomal protein L32